MHNRCFASNKALTLMLNKIFWRMLMVVIDYFPKLWKSTATANCLVTNILQSVFFCVQQKKETHTGLERTWARVNDVNYSFNVIKHTDFAQKTSLKHLHFTLHLWRSQSKITKNIAYKFLFMLYYYQILDSIFLKSTTFFFSAQVLFFNCFIDLSSVFEWILTKLSLNYPFFSVMQHFLSERWYSTVKMC